MWASLFLGGVELALRNEDLLLQLLHFVVKVIGGHPLRALLLERGKRSPGLVQSRRRGLHCRAFLGSLGVARCSCGRRRRKHSLSRHKHPLLQAIEVPSVGRGHASPTERGLKLCQRVLGLGELLLRCVTRGTGVGPPAHVRGPVGLQLRPPPARPRKVGKLLCGQHRLGLDGLGVAAAAAAHCAVTVLLNLGQFAALDEHGLLELFLGIVKGSRVGRIEAVPLAPSRLKLGKGGLCFVESVLGRHHRPSPRCVDFGAAGLVTRVATARGQLLGLGHPPPRDEYPLLQLLHLVVVAIAVILSRGLPPLCRKLFERFLGVCEALVGFGHVERPGCRGAVD
eukprot:m.326598 g.326598  ORF g.326598 m.326598 type:complete len:339 (-) comp16481_c0_seq14:2983-3999(-)